LQDEIEERIFEIYSLTLEERNLVLKAKDVYTNENEETFSISKSESE
jgi:hypothetical protein